MPPSTPRTQPRQVAERVSHDFASAAAILDEGLICHVGFNIAGQPYVIPMAYARVGDRLLLHGAVASRLMSNLAQGLPVCATVTHLDGIVLARSTFNHSMNYRSVVIFGNAELITDPSQKAAALEQLVEFLVPGRAAQARAADNKELNATTLLALPIREFSVKQRSGPPQDAAKDMALTVWTGEIPLRTVADAPRPDPALNHTGPTPSYARDYLARRRNLDGVCTDTETQPPS